MHKLRAVVIRQVLIKFTDVVCVGWSGLSCNYKFDPRAKKSAHKLALYPVFGSFQNSLPIPGAHNIPAERSPCAWD